MAIRDILTGADNETLRKKCRVVQVVDKRILDLLDDMKETLKQAEGVGLAAPQVGVLKRVVIVDVGEGAIELVNPVVTDQEGEQFTPEGCLSLPDLFGKVRRPKKVTVTGLDRNGKKTTVTGEDLLAKALCHEIDHLDGILFCDKAVFDEEEADV